MPTEIFKLRVTRHVWRLIATKAKVQFSDLKAIANEDISRAFWQWVKDNPTVPILITEGAKKTASLLSHGYVAVGLPGIYSGYRSKDGEGNPLIKKELIPQFEPFTPQGGNGLSALTMTRSLALEKLSARRSPTLESY
jgi:hypothetical protein